MQVVDHEQQGRGRGDVDEQGGERGEHPAGLGALDRRRPVGHEVREEGRQHLRAGAVHRPRPGERREHRAERVDQGLQEQRALGGVAARGRDPPAGGGGELRDLGGEPRLADPRLAGEQHEPGPPAGRGVPAPGQPGDLVGAAHAVARARRTGPGRGPVRAGALVPQEREVLLPRPWCGFDAQLVGELGPQPVVVLDGARGLAGELVGPHDQAVGRLVEAVGAHRVGPGPSGPVGVARAQRGPGVGVAGAPDQLAPLRAGRLDPGLVRLLGQGLAGAQQLEGPGGGARGEPGGAGGEPPVGLVEQAGRLVEVDGDVRGRAEAVAGPVAQQDVGVQAAAEPADERRHAGGGVPRRPAGRCRPTAPRRAGRR